MLHHPIFRYNAALEWKDWIWVDLENKRSESRKGGSERGKRALMCFLLTCFSPGVAFWEAMSMTRIHQQSSSGQHGRWYQFGVRSAQGARHAIWVFTVLAFLAALAAAQ